MNYLDLLPDDVTKIINRKVRDSKIAERKKQRKENRRLKNIEENQERIYNKFVMLYKKYKYISSMKRFMRGSVIQERIIDNNYKYCETLYESIQIKYGSSLINSEFYFHNKIPYIKVSFLSNGKLYNKKKF